MDPDAYRLPTHIEPHEYAIALRARPDEPLFHGKVTIGLEVHEETESIVLHARDLQIDEAVLSRSGRDHLADVQVDEARETITLTFSRPVPAGEATLEITYVGEVSRGMAGLYLSKDGDEACLATQCEATDARAIFPCMDEPSFKARIRWTVLTAPGLTVLANGPLVDRRQDPEQDVVTWEFGPTRPISTYLAACAIGNFGSTEELVHDGVPFKVWALGDKEGYGEHANRFSTELMAWYQDYFATEYPFSKYDQVAVPSFSFGAMENVGLVVYRPSALLMDPNTTSWSQRKRVDLVVAHEMAHMWFGNLVTMAWWDDLWLNEAFAEWIAHKVVDELEPDLQVWQTFADRTHGALDTDALESTHAIYHPVETPSEAVEMFDAITYGKGAAVMRMLEAFLTPEAFRAGLRSYMDAFSEDNARGSDLWQHLAKASKQPVDEIMGSWIGQEGHPVVDVDLLDGDGPPRLALEQRRFRSTPEQDASQATWPVPMVLRYKDDQGVHETRHLLEARQDTVALDVSGELAWVHANAGDMGFYRTKPRGKLRERLVAGFPDLEPVERRGLLRDQWDLVRSDDLELGAFLELLDTLVEHEEHFAVVSDLVGRVRHLEKVLETQDRSKGLAGLRSWAAGAFGRRLEALGADPAPGEQPPTRQLRASLLQGAAGIGRQGDAVAAALELAERERADPKAIDPNLAGQAVAVAAQQGDQAYFQLHVGTYQERREGQASPQEVERYLYTLPAFREPSLVDATLELLEGDLVPKQSVGPLLVGLLQAPHGQVAAFQHVRESLPELQETLGESWVARIVEASGQMPPTMGDEVVAFWEKSLDDAAQQALGRARERLTQRGELYERITDELEAWAVEQGKGA